MVLALSAVPKTFADVLKMLFLIFNLEEADWVAKEQMYICQGFASTAIILLYIPNSYRYGGLHYWPLLTSNEVWEVCPRWMLGVISSKTSTTWSHLWNKSCIWKTFMITYQLNFLNFALHVDFLAVKPLLQLLIYLVVGGKHTSFLGFWHTGS